MFPSTKVVIAIPVLLIGGTEIQTLNLVKVLSGAGYEVTIICYYEHESEMVSDMKTAGADVILLKLERVDGLFSLLKKLIFKFKELSPEIVHVQYVAPGLIPIIAARLAGIKKVIATVHQPGRTYGWKARLMLRFGARLCNLFFCVSKSAEESWFGDSAFFTPELYRKGRRHFTIYNGVDTELIARESCSENVARLRSSLGLEGKKVVGYVGRLRCEKGPHILVSAFANVVQEIPEAVLLVVGDGPDRQNLEKKARDLGIERNIIWLGQKPQNEVFQLYGLMDVVVMPSYFEGFGLTAAEAMASGVPVICSDVDGLREIVDNQKTGLFVQIGDYERMALQIINLLTKCERIADMRRACKSKADRCFSIVNYKGAILSAYQHILE